MAAAKGDGGSDTEAYEAYEACGACGGTGAGSTSGEGGDDAYADADDDADDEEEEEEGGAAALVPPFRGVPAVPTVTHREGGEVGVKGGVLSPGPTTTTESPLTA